MIKIIGLILLCVIILFLSLFFVNKLFEEEIPGEEIIGGQRDEHGCLGPAGYSWNETEEECVREWLSGEERYQVKDFYSCKSAGYPILESYPLKCETPSGKIFVKKD